MVGGYGWGRVRKRVRDRRGRRSEAGGCHLDRPIEDLVREADFDITDIEHDHMPGPKFMLPWGYLYQGVATKTEPA